MDPAYVDSLVVVGTEELIFRFVHPTSYDAASPLGERVQLSALATKDFTPSPVSSGASAYVKSRLAGGLQDLFVANSKWRAHRVAEVPAASLVAIGLQVRYSPGECPFPSVSHAHASLIGITRENRPRVLRLIEQHLQP